MKRNGQSTVEYFIIMTIILTAIISSGVIYKSGKTPGVIRTIFQGYFDKAAEQMK